MKLFTLSLKSFFSFSLTGLLLFIISSNVLSKELDEIIVTAEKRTESLQDVSKAVKEAKSGQIQFKNDKAGIVHAGIGKLNFKDEDLLENIKAFYATINKSKPGSVKGSFIKKVTIASTMGLGLVINVGDLRSWYS